VLLDALCERLKVPRRYCDLARVVARYHGLVHKVDELRPETILDLLEGMDAFRRPERFEQALTACEADYRGRTGYEEREYPQAVRVRRFLAAAKSVDVGSIAAAASEPTRIPQLVRKARVQAIRQAD
jgi:tRNA nucleotidyltransferase (CCA-adding enzyme)